MNLENREKVMDCYSGICVECYTNNNVECHHKLADTKPNRKQYPLFIDSVFNYIALCGKFEKDCHEKCKHKYKISHREAEMYEEYLRSIQNVNH